MPKYKIIVIKHQLKGRNVFAVAGDIVDGSQFINLQDSLDGGFCKEHVEDGKLEDEQLTMSKDAGDEPTALEIELKAVKKLKKDDLMAYATEKEIDFDSELKKDDIFQVVSDELTVRFSEEEE